MLTKVAPR